MPIKHDIPQPIQFYEAEGHRHWSKRRCAGQHEQVIHQAHDKWPHFVIHRDEEDGSEWEWYLVDAAGEGTLLSPSVIQMVTANEQQWIFPVGNTGIAMPCGWHYLRITDGDLEYYSEWFQVTNRANEMVLFSWRDNCMKLNVPWDMIPDEQYGTKPGPFMFHFWADTELGEPVLNTTENFKDTGTGTVRTDAETTRKIAFHDAVAEHIVECFHGMKHHSVVLVTDPEGASEDGEERTYEAAIDAITSNYLRTGCLTDTLVYLIFHDEWKGGCCEQFIPDCVEPCVTADGIWIEGDPEPTIGDVYLLASGRYGTYYRDNTIEHPVDADGFGDITMCISQIAVVDGVVLRFTGDVDEPWVEAIYLIEVNEEVCDEGIVSVMGGSTPGYSVQIQYSADGSAWTSIGYTLSFGEFTTGSSITLPDATVFVRAQLVGPECVIATSDRMAVPCSDCAGDNVFMFSGIGASGTNDTEISAVTTTGYFTVSIDNVRTTFGDGIAVNTQTGVMEAEDDTPRQFCIYPSDADGNNSGSFQLIDLNSEGVTSVVSVGNQSSMISLYLGSNAITAIDISTAPAIQFLGLDDCALTADQVDAVFMQLDSAGGTPGIVNTSGGTSAAPTAASLAARTNMASDGWTIFTN